MLMSCQPLNKYIDFQLQGGTEMKVLACSSCGHEATQVATEYSQEQSKCFHREIPTANSSAGSNCCTCNCQPALQAILQELKTMRKIMQIQAVAAQNRQQPPIPLALED
uniref:Uncharacterized protein n=1 Tax=Sphaerodactylus townsendi TaxID=933632 RepID=A0ACB8FQA4_9SAUR